MLKESNFDILSINSLLGSASIKQVYEVIDSNNNLYVWKFLRPNLDVYLEEDLHILWVLSKHFWLKNISSEIWEAIKEELNFSNEVSNQKRLKENLQWKVFWNYTVNIPNIIKANDLAIIEEKAIWNSLKQLATSNNHELNDIYSSIVESYFYQVFIDWFFHSDLHQWNIIISWKEISFIDPGLCCVINNKEKKYFAYFLINLLDKNPDKLINVISKSVIDWNLDIKTKNEIRNLLDKDYSIDQTIQYLLKILSNNKIYQNAYLFIKWIASISPYIDKISKKQISEIKKSLLINYLSTQVKWFSKILSTIGNLFGKK